MSKVLLVEDNTSTVKKIMCYIDNISADLETLMDCVCEEEAA